MSVSRHLQKKQRAHFAKWRRNDASIDRDGDVERRRPRRRRTKLLVDNLKGKSIELLQLQIYDNQNFREILDSLFGNNVSLLKSFFHAILVLTSYITFKSLFDLTFELVSGDEFVRST